jgi:hypothetical protein
MARSAHGGKRCASPVRSCAVKQALIDWRKRGEALLEERFRRAQKEGDLKRSLDPGDLARYVSALLTGLGVQAANGASRKQMSHIVDLAMSSLPI